MDITDLIISPIVSTCECLCSHCLLGSKNDKLGQFDFDQLENMIFRLKEEADHCSITVKPYRSAEYRHLPKVMEWNRSLGWNDFILNLNGTRVRQGKILQQWVEWLITICAVTSVEISWFGTEEYMDRFVHRKGYYEYLMNLTHELNKYDVCVYHKIFVMDENRGMLNTLWERLVGTGNICVSVVDYRGNGKNESKMKLTQPVLETMPDWVKQDWIFCSGRYKTEREWINQVKETHGFSKTGMTLIYVPTENSIYSDISMEHLNEFALKRMEEIEDFFPEDLKLAQMYGDCTGSTLWDYRSLLMRWQELFVMDHDPAKTNLLFSDSRTDVLWR